MAATKAGDIPTVLNLMSDDALFLTSGQKPFGKQEFRANFEAMNDATIDGRAVVQELEVVGDWAWLRNHLDLTVTPAKGSAVERTGATLTIFRKEHGGSWRLYRDANFVN